MPSVRMFVNSSGFHRAPGGLSGLSFTTSRGGNALQPGDTWQVSITGAAPGYVVSVLGNTAGNKTDSVLTPMGVTDNNGSFSKSGQVTSNDLGTWIEQWFINETPVGSFSFTVAQPSAPSPAAPPPAGSGNSSGGSGGGSSSGGGTPSTSGTAPPSWFSQSMIAGIPNWGLLVAAGAALMLFRGK